MVIKTCYQFIFVKCSDRRQFCFQSASIALTPNLAIFELTHEQMKSVSTLEDQSQTKYTVV